MQHTEGKFPGRNNLNLYYQSWSPEGIPIAVLVVVHGLAEHSGRYSNIVNYFVPKGYAVYALDHRGHGKSDGIKGYVERFSYYVDDLKTLFDKVRKEHDSTKIFLVGHSMGGTITAAYALRYQSELDGIITSGALLKIGSSITKAAMLMAKILSFLLPKMGVSVLDASTISHDKAVVEAYVNDPLVYRGKTSARLGAEILSTVERMPARLSSLYLPMLVMHGTADRLSDPEGSKLLFERAGSKDKKLILYEDFYHEIFNEPQREQVFSDMDEWLKRHV